MRWLRYLGFGLIGVELWLIKDLLMTLIKVLRLSYAWPHHIADSEVFYQQLPLSEGFEAVKTLFYPINEHKIVLTRLVEFLPPLFGMEQGQWGVLTSFALIIVSFAFFVLCLVSLGGNKKSVWFFAAVLAGFLLFFNPWQSENLIWSVNVHWFFQNLLLVFSTYLFLASVRPSFISPWWDVFIPFLAILNGGQAYALLAAVSLPRIWIFGRRWLYFLAVSFSFVLVRLLPDLESSVSSSFSFDFQFFIDLLRLWWPSAGIWLSVMTVLSLCLILRFASRPQDPVFWRKLAVISIPIVYGAAFAFLATLSRSSYGDAALLRSGYVTPIMMIGLGYLLLTWFLFCEKEINWLAPLQIFFLVFSLICYPGSFWTGFRKPSFLRKQELMIEHLNRQITWFHCVGVEGGLQGRLSLCVDSKLWEAHGHIRGNAQSVLPDDFDEYSYISSKVLSRKISALRASSISRLYVIKQHLDGRSYIVDARQIVASSGDFLLEIEPGNVAQLLRLRD